MSEVIQGKLRRLVIDDTEISIDGLAAPYQRRFIRCIDEYGPAPSVEAVKAIARNVTGRGVVIPGEYRTIDCTHLAPARSVNICDVCGCAHYAFMGYICWSCWEGVTKVKLQQFQEKMQRAVKAVEKFGAALGSCGTFMQFPNERMARGFAHVHINPVHPVDMMISFDSPGGSVGSIGDIERAIQPDFNGFIEGLADSIALNFNVPRSALLMPAPKLNLSTIYGRLGRCWDEPTRPANAAEFIEQRKARRQKEHGPKKHGKWWLR